MRHAEDIDEGISLKEDKVIGLSRYLISRSLIGHKQSIKPKSHPHPTFDLPSN